MRVVLPETAAAHGIVASAFEPLPPVRSEALLHARCAAPDVIAERVEIAASSHGWQCAVMRGTRAGRPVIRAFFCFLDYGALVEASASSDEDRELAWSIMREARPEWSDVASLWHIFDR